jgi:UDP-N-acetylmuramoyl-tripeptide--D-alanyl-D-alanine ligase
MITLAEIIHSLGATQVIGGQFPLPETVIDSRNVIPGALFVALEGENTDGHLYLAQAFQKGATAAIISKELPQFVDQTIDLRTAEISTIDLSNYSQPYCLLVKDSLDSLQNIAAYWRNKLEIHVIGITGSVGKSSTKELISELLSYQFSTFKNPGNYNNEIGLPLTILNVGRGYQKLVLEMGFYYPGEISFLCEISKPTIGVITNIGTVHAERAGSKEAIAKGKSELVKALPEKPFGTAILNYDDPYVRAMAKDTQANIVFYGINPKADIWADEISGLGLKGIKFRLHWHEESIVLQAPILGRHSVQTILRAAAVAITEGLTLSNIKRALSVSNTQLRLVAVRTDSGALILDDTYNATPESTIAALDLLGELDGQKIAVLGDMLELGQYEELGHVQVGEKAAHVVNHLIAVGERGRIIAETARREGLSATSVTCVKDALEAAELLKYNLTNRDVVLVKGSHGLRMDRISTILEAAK